MGERLGLPTTFQLLLGRLREVLSSREDLVRKHLIQVESEQIVMGAYRRVSEQELSRSDLYLRMHEGVSLAHVQCALDFAQRRCAGELLQHILGYQFFFLHEYEVSPDVLIPRPETEVLVSLAIERIEQFSQPPRLGIEIGLGSGILSIELLHHFSSLKMIASEISPQACLLAMRNAQRILKDSASRLTLCPVQESHDVCQSLLKQGVKADFLISNPPYLLSSAEEVEEEVLHNEPHEALFGPSERPSYYYEQMAQFGRDLLTSEGVMFLELPHERSQDIVRMLHDQGWETSVFQDLTKRDRVCLAQWRGEKN